MDRGCGMQDAIRTSRRGGPPKQQAGKQSRHRGAEPRKAPGQRTLSARNGSPGEPAGRKRGGLTADGAPVRKHTPWLSGLVGDLLGQSPGNMPLSNSTSELPKHPTSPEFASGNGQNGQRTVERFEPRDGRGGHSHNPVQLLATRGGQREGSRGFSRRAQVRNGTGQHWGMSRSLPSDTGARSSSSQGSTFEGPRESGGLPGQFCGSCLDFKVETQPQG